MKARYILKTIIVIITITFTYVTYFPIFLILYLLSRPFDPRRYFVHWLTAKWGLTYLLMSPGWKIKITGKEKIVRGKPCVLISNHQSMVDICLLYQAYPHGMWVSKVENFKVPVLGWVMSMNGYIKVDRKNPRSFPKMFEDCAEKLKMNDTIIMFPEGTRSVNGEIGRFKEGAFKVAIENKVPIIPIVLDGAARLFPKKAVKLNGDKVLRLKVLDEVPYEKFPSYNPAELKEYFKDLMSKELNDLQKS
jgi:1-acyl-sn-glycerol-3-phosphate acyltransferase